MSGAVGRRPGIVEAVDRRRDAGSRQAGDGREELAVSGYRLGDVLLGHRHALLWEESPAADTDDQRPSRQGVAQRGHVGRVGADQSRQIGSVHDEQLIGHPEAGEPVGEVHEIVERGGGDEEQLLRDRPGVRT